MKTRSANAMIKRSQHGFSLVELMVAITLGFIIIGAVGYLFLGSRQTYRSTDAMSRIQENARYALQTMAHDVRMAGYVGCGNLQAMTVTTIAKSPPPVLTTANAITGWDTGAGAAAFGGIARPAGDAISVMGAFGGGVNLTGNLAPNNANIQIQGNPFGFQQNDVLIVTNCTNADIFKVTNHPGSAGLVTLTTGMGSNNSNNVGTYGPNDFVMKFEQYTYFIGTNPSGGRSLYRDSLSEGTVELADNVWDMQILYLFNGAYVPAGSVTDWSKVLSARINLLLVSQDSVLSTPQTYKFFSDTAVAPTSFTPGAGSADRLLMHQVFTTTVGIRNRLL
ncbi:MAG: PilW family protein [Sulfuriferula sp.]